MEEQKKKRAELKGKAAAKDKDRDKQREKRDDSTKRNRSKSRKKDKGKKRNDSRDKPKKKRGDSSDDDTLKGKRGDKRDDSASPDESESESDGDVSTPGYFDEALRKLENHVPANNIPKFNEEFQNTAKLPKHKNLVVADGVTPSTTRGHVTFNILGPGPKELKKLVKFFTQNGNTRGSVQNVSEDKM